MSNKGRNANSDELSLWQQFVQGINPLKKHDAAHAKQPDKTKKSTTRVKQSSHSPSIFSQQIKKEIITKPVNNGLDKSTLKKLQKGNMQIDSRLDLHGMTQDRAHSSLNNFVTQAFQRQQRCVLVITGKGSKKDPDDIYSSHRGDIGILKSRLPQWVLQDPLRDIVLRTEQAQPKHGGGGAFYLYLKRQRP